MLGKYPPRVHFKRAWVQRKEAVGKRETQIALHNSLYIYLKNGIIWQKEKGAREGDCVARLAFCKENKVYSDPRKGKVDTEQGH